MVMTKVERKELAHLEWLDRLGRIGSMTAEQLRLSELRKKELHH